MLRPLCSVPYCDTYYTFSTSLLPDGPFRLVCIVLKGGLHLDLGIDPFLPSVLDYYRDLKTRKISKYQPPDGQYRFPGLGGLSLCSSGPSSFFEFRRKTWVNSRSIHLGTEFLTVVDTECSLCHL